MRRGAALRNRTEAIAQLCRSGLAPAALRDRVLSRLRSAVPFDAAFWTTVDPVTLLFTAPHQEDIPRETIPYFVENEFLGDDVNAFVALTRDAAGVGTLAGATGGALEASARYRDVLRPLGLGDELRAVLRVGGTCWGCLCLHREAGAAFSEAEAAFVRAIAPLLADGIRAGLLAAAVEACGPADAPGLLVLSPDGAFVSTTAAGRQWLDALGHPDPERVGVPAAIRALAGRLPRPGEGGGAPAPPRPPRGGGRRAAPSADADAVRPVGGIARLTAAGGRRGRCGRDHRRAVALGACPGAHAGLRPDQPRADPDQSRLPRAVDARDRRTPADLRGHGPGPPEVDLRQDRRPQPAGARRGDPAGAIPAARDDGCVGGTDGVLRDVAAPARYEALERVALRAAGSSRSSENITTSTSPVFDRKYERRTPSRVYPARSATRSEGPFPAYGVSSSRTRPSSANAHADSTRTARTATPRRRACGAVQYPTSARSWSQSIVTRPTAPRTSSPFAASTTASSSEAAASCAASVCATNARAWSSL